MDFLTEIPKHTVEFTFASEGSKQFIGDCVWVPERIGTAVPRNDADEISREDVLYVGYECGRMTTPKSRIEALYKS